MNKVAKKKITEDQYIKLCNDLNADLEKAYQAIKDLRDNLNGLMKGDEEGPYWNGASAKAAYFEAKISLNNAISIYKEAAEAWSKIELRYILLLREGYFR